MVKGETVGVADLLVGSIGFVLLQRWGRRNTDRAIREDGIEDTIWDVVILDNGLRADVVGTQQTSLGNDIEPAHSSSRRPSSFLLSGAGGNDANLEKVEKEASSASLLGRFIPHVSLPPDRQHEFTDEEVQLYIMQQLPHGSRANVKTDSITARTITVDLFDADSVNFLPPPGTTKVEEMYHHNQNHARTETGEKMPNYTVVFRTVSNQSRNSELRHGVPMDRDGPSEKRTNRSLLPSPEYSLRTNSNNSRLDQSLPTSPHESNHPDPESRSYISKRPMSSGYSSSDSEASESTLKRESCIKQRQRVRPNSEDKLISRLSLNPFSKTAASSGKDKENLPSNRNTLFSLSKEPSQKKSKDIKPSAAPSDLPDTTNKSTQKGRARLSRDKTHISFDGRPSTGYMVRERGSESFVAQTDAYSSPTQEKRPSSPMSTRNHIRSTSSLSRAKSDRDIPMLLNATSRAGTPVISRRNSFKSGVPSIYSMATGSDTSLLLAPRSGTSAYDDQAAITTLSQSGQVPGLFPSSHIVRNIQRFSRFSSASYGSNFLRVMGISTSSQQRQTSGPDYHEHDSFCDHTGMPASAILLSSYVDPAGGSNSAGETAEGFPLVHYLSLDHDSKAAVLTLRGTWGFEDVLTDMTCDYADLHWMGRTFQVHKGMLASAKRLLEGGGGRVMATIKAALEEFPDYGVIFCGHSLGGGVAALLATLISQPQNPALPGPSFVTASHHSLSTQIPVVDQVARNIQQQPGQFCLPPGRPVHVYAYGPPAVMCPTLRQATQGLITTVVNGQDLVPTLSLGILHDFHSVALSFKRDVTDARSQVKSRIWDAITRSIANKLHMDTPLSVHAGDDLGEDSWSWNTLKSLRSNLTSAKLLPPGEVFVVETMRVLQRDPFMQDSPTSDGYPRLGRPATRVQLKYIRDVESRFREIRFGSGMIWDHSPARYEASLAVLASGVLE